MTKEKQIAIIKKGIKLTGVKKSFIAKKFGLSPSEMSKMLTTKRNYYAHERTNMANYFKALKDGDAKI